MECSGISLGTRVGKYIESDLLCMGLPLSTFTPSRDNAKPEGTRGPSHRDSRASICGFLLLLYWWPRSQATLWMHQRKVLTKFQAAALCSPALSVQPPTGPSYQRPLCSSLSKSVGRTSKLDLGKCIWPHKPGHTASGCC